MRNKATTNIVFSTGVLIRMLCPVFALFIHFSCFGQGLVERKGHFVKTASNEKGRNLIINGKLDEAITSYAPLAQNPANKTLIAEYAYALALRGIYDAALMNLDRIGYHANDQDVNFFTAQVFALMNYDDVANEFWQSTGNGNIPEWIALHYTGLLEKYKSKLPRSKKTNSEALKEKFKRANELAAYHSYFQSIAVFHEIIDIVPNEYLPYAGYSIPLEKTGALERSAKVIEKAISLVGDHPQDVEKRQFLEHRLETIKARKAESLKNNSHSISRKKPEANHPQMMAYTGAMVAPSLTTLNFRIGYYLMDQTNASFNFGLTNTPDAGTSVNLGLSMYSSIRSFVYGLGLQYSSAGYSSIQYSAGFRIKYKKSKRRKKESSGEETADLFLDVSEGLSSGAPITWSLSYGTSFYFGKRKVK